MRLRLVQRLIAHLLGEECGNPDAASWSLRWVLFLEGNRVA